jgi:hypothetical protein
VPEVKRSEISFPFNLKKGSLGFFFFFLLIETSFAETWVSELYTNNNIEQHLKSSIEVEKKVSSPLERKNSQGK